MTYFFLLMFAALIASVSFDWEDGGSDENNSL